MYLMYHLPNNVISEAVSFVYINLQLVYELPSSTRFGQFRKFGKKLSWGHRPPQPPLRKQILHGIRVLVFGCLCVGFDLLALLTLEI